MLNVLFFDGIDLTGEIILMYCLLMEYLYLGYVNQSNMNYQEFTTLTFVCPWLMKEKLFNLDYLEYFERLDKKRFQENLQRKQTRTIKQQQVTYPFRIPLGSNLPPSCEFKEFSVIYYLEIYHDGRLLPNTHKQITLAPPTPQMTVPLPCKVTGKINVNLKFPKIYSSFFFLSRFWRCNNNLWFTKIFLFWSGLSVSFYVYFNYES